jgi:hypothetical protein
LNVAVVIVVEWGRCRFLCTVRFTSNLEVVVLGALNTNFRAKLFMLLGN